MVAEVVEVLAAQGQQERVAPAEMEALEQHQQLVAPQKLIPQAAVVQHNQAGHKVQELLMSAVTHLRLQTAVTGQQTRVVEVVVALVVAALFTQAALAALEL
jgi:hypothetical protein